MGGGGGGGGWGGVVYSYIIISSINWRKNGAGSGGLVDLMVQAYDF